MKTNEDCHSINTILNQSDHDNDICIGLKSIIFNILSGLFLSAK